jgi:hypothetical protein
MDVFYRLDIHKFDRKMSIFLRKNENEIQVDSILLNLDNSYDWCLNVNDLPSRLYKPEIENKSPALYEEICRQIIGTYFLVEWLEYCQFQAKRMENELFAKWLKDLENLTTQLS